MNKDFRLKDNRNKENEFICKLRSNKQLYMYANKILFGYIQCALKYKIPKKDIINMISIEILSNKTNTKKNSIETLSKYTKKRPLNLKNGFDCNKYDCNSILKFKNYKQLAEYNIKHNISILQITSSYYRFQTNNKFFTMIYKSDPILKQKIVDTFNLYFFTEYSFDEIDKIVSKSEGYWFYTWLLVFVESPTKNLMHRNSNEDKDYIREWLKTITDYNTIKQKDIVCGKNMYENNYNVMVGDTFMKPVYNGIFWNTMKSHKKSIIAGFSSSTVLCYNSVFNITRILNPTPKNKVMLLCLIALDYYQLHHSLSEVVSFYSVEAGFNDYKLTHNDVDYVTDKIKTYIPELNIL
jgi:hypothetical protein